MRAAAYCRVSTDKEDQLNSLEAQKNFFGEFAAKERYTLVNIYADEGISGTRKKNRKQFLRLMEDAEKGLFDIVCVKDISRLARNTVDFLQSIRRLKALNIETLFVTNSMSVLGNSEFIPTIFAALAQEESANMSKRIKFGKDENAKKGRVPNFVYGYDKVKGDYFNLIVNEAEAGVVRRIFHMYLTRGCGAGKIAALLNEEGARTKRGSRFTQNAVVRILTNEIYTGKIINKKQEVKDFLTGARSRVDERDWLITDKPELRIVSGAEFKKAREILAGRHESFKMKRERHSNAHPLSSLIKCGHCGHSFRRVSGARAKWVCGGRNANGAGACPNRTVICERGLLEAIRGYLLNALRSVEGADKSIIREYNRVYNMGNIERDAKELTAELNRLKKKKDRELELYSDGFITKAELAERAERFGRRMDEIAAELELACGGPGKPGACAARFSALFKNLEQALSPDVFTNATLKKLIGKIIADAEGGVDIHMNPLEGAGITGDVPYSDNRT